MSPRARQTKSKARITAYEKLLSQDSAERQEDLEIYIPPGPGWAIWWWRRRASPRAIMSGSWWRT